MSQPSSKSPFWEAFHARRYWRQEQIRNIEAKTGRRLLAYVANVNSQGAGLGQSDITPFQDLIADCSTGCDIDLLIQTPGGDIDAAEKIVYMLRQRSKSLRVIVAERAKSAGTLIALAADELLMSDTSELGPIDPQISTFSADGRLLSYGAHSFLDGVESIKQDAAATGKINPAYFPLLSQIDAALLDYCRKAVARSQEFAEKWLKQYMLQGDPAKAAEIAVKLVSDKQYITSHGKVIDWQEVRGLGLNVTYYAPDDPLWIMIWRLYAEYEYAMRAGEFIKLYESTKVSLPF